MKNIVNLTSDLTTLEMKRNGVESLQGMYLNYLLKNLSFSDSQKEGSEEEAVLEIRAMRLASLACGSNHKDKRYDAALLSPHSPFSVKYLSGALRAEGVEVLYV